MGHLHDLIDFVVNAYITYDNKVLLIKHKQLGIWLPIGGHIELSEDPEEALFREIKEECGLEVEIISQQPNMNFKDFKSLPLPAFLDIHRISDTHRHIAFEYFAKAKTNDIILNEEEHDAIRWFKSEDLDDAKFNLLENIKFYCKKALEMTK